MLLNYAFELWCWRRLLRIPWTARRYNQSILEEISPEYSLERLMLKLKLQYVGHLMQRADSFEKTLMLGKIEGEKGDDIGWDGWIASLTQWTWVWVNSRSCWWTRRSCVLQTMGSQRIGHDWATELNWTEAPIKLLLLSWVPVHIKFLCVPFENEVLGNGRRWQKSKMGRSPASKKYIKKSSECGTTPTEQLLSNSRRPQTSKKESQSP